MMKRRFNMHILMVAAENDALPGGKVGGIGDVVRDVPPALAGESCKVTVATPSYGFLHLLPGARKIASLPLRFDWTEQEVKVYEVPGKTPHGGVRHTVIHHPGFEAYDLVHGRHQIYVNDPPEAPFQSDSIKYALFCMAVAESVTRDVFGKLDVLHLHDWHAGFLLILREFHPRFQALKGLRTAFTIHNLAYQGIRPLRGGPSSLEAWCPGLTIDLTKVTDPRYTDCVNLMAAGIRLSDVTHTVSPSYAEEILQPSDQDKRGYYGGEGLEDDLMAVKKTGKLFGILNGCEYPPGRTAPKQNFPDLINLLKSNVLSWAGSQQTLSASHFIAHARLAELSSQGDRPDLILTSVSRVNDQKMRLLIEPGGAGASGLQGILQNLSNNGVYIMLGTGDPRYERFFVRMSSQFSNFIFLNGYSDDCAKALYANGDLFLMPSSYEPCGISQMLAMRDGQPCLVHKVGGLKDTVHDGVNGFSFEGETIPEQVDNMVGAFKKAMDLKRGASNEWRGICRKALESRFLWKDTVARYIEKLYTAP
jgi:starch synthase